MISKIRHAAIGMPAHYHACKQGQCLCVVTQASKLADWTCDMHAHIWSHMDKHY